jgi:hypothetical protein
MNGIDEYERDRYRKVGPSEKIDSSGSPGKAEEKKQGGDGVRPPGESHATIFV